jgi:TctA family transporter
MWIGNLMLVILNLPLVGIWVKLLRIPYRMLYVSIVVFCCIGTYSVTSNLFDIYVMAFFAAFGFRRSLLISRGDFMVFLQEPISLGFLIAAVGLLLVVAMPAIRRTRNEAMQE